MAALANFVLETCNAPGSSAGVTLAGASPGRVSFASVFSSGQTVFYFMDDGAQAEWGNGVLTAGSPNTFNRTTVIGNTAGTTARLNFSGTTRIYNEVPASRLLYADPATGLVVVPAAAVITGHGAGVNPPDAPQMAQLDRVVLQNVTFTAAQANFATVLASGYNWYDIEFSFTSDKSSASTGALVIYLSANGGSTFSSSLLYAVTKNGTLSANSSSTPVGSVAVTCVGDGTFSGRLRISVNAWVNLQTSAILAGVVQSCVGALTAASLGNVNCFNMAFTNGSILAGGIVRVVGGY